MRFYICLFHLLIASSFIVWAMHIDFVVLQILFCFTALVNIFAVAAEVYIDIEGLD